MNRVMINGIVINNFENYANKCKFIVVRNVNGEKWFYDAFTEGEEEKAYRLANEINGEILVKEC